MAIRESKAPRKKVGLALGSGAARGLAHIGVLEVLEKEGAVMKGLTDSNNTGDSGYVGL